MNVKFNWRRWLVGAVGVTTLTLLPALTANAQPGRGEGFRPGFPPRPSGGPRDEGPRGGGPDHLERRLDGLQKQLEEITRLLREIREQDNRRPGPPSFGPRPPFGNMPRPDFNRGPQGRPGPGGDRREGDRRPDGPPDRRPEADRREGGRRTDGPPMRRPEGPAGERREGDRRPEAGRGPQNPPGPGRDGPRPGAERRPEGPGGERREGERRPDAERRDGE